MVAWSNEDKKQVLHLMQEHGAKWTTISKRLLQEYKIKRSVAQIRNMYLRLAKNEEDTETSEPKTHKRVNLCGVCGLRKKGHICGGHPFGNVNNLRLGSNDVQPYSRDQEPHESQEPQVYPPNTEHLRGLFDLVQSGPESHSKLQVCRGFEQAESARREIEQRPTSTSVFDLWRNDKSFAYDDFTASFPSHGTETVTTSLASSSNASPVLYGTTVTNQDHNNVEHIPPLELPPSSVLRNCLSHRKNSSQRHLDRNRLVSDYLRRGVVDSVGA